MISRKYSELLPQYLAGSNIRRHSEILEEMDKQIDDKLDILSNAYNLQRPILIERVQDEPGSAVFRVHVHTNSPIQRITVTPETSEEIIREYDEDDVVVDETIEFTVSATLSDLVLTGCTVLVETYEDRVYEKGYPENDVAHDNIYDHDEFLDITGRLLCIPRRSYNVINSQQASDYENTYPRYWAKDTTLSYITEDDYYYSQRLQKFVSGLAEGKNLLPLMADVLYEWDTSSVVHVKNRSTYLYDSLEDVVEDTAEYDILEMARPLYDNMDYSNLQEVLREYYPITRILFALTRKYIEWSIQDFRVNNGRLLFTAYTEYSEDDTGEDVYKCTFLTDYFNYKDRIVASEGHTTNMNAVWTGNIRMDWLELLFARIRYRQMYECKNGNSTDNITYNILTGTNCGDMRGISVLLQENEEDDNWNIEDWVTRLGSGGIPPQEESSTDGTVINLGSECNTYLTPLPDCDWCVHLNLSELYGVGDLAPVFVLSYLNNADGRMELTVENTLQVTMKEYNADGSVARTSTLDELFGVVGAIVPLVVERKGNSITFAYWNTSGTLTRHTRTYTSLSVNGALYFHTYLNEVLLHSHNRYAIGEYNSDRADLPMLVLDNWSVISRGTGSTNPVYSDEGILTPGRYNFQVWKQAITTDKEYNIYFYQATNAYRILYLGVCNSNTSTPTRYPTIPTVTDYGAVTGINKARIFYDETTSKWYIQINDGIAVSQLEHVENGRYIDIQSSTGDISNYKILAITETSNGGGAMTKYSILCDEDFDKGFNTNNWTGNGTRTIETDGTISLTYGTNHNHYYNIPLPDTDWIIQLEATIDATAQSTIQYSNNVDGATYLHIPSYSTQYIKETTVINGSHTQTKNTTVDKFITSSNKTNNITIRRSGTNIIFKYTSNDTNQTVEYTREYTELNSNGTLQIQTWNGAKVTLHALTILQRIGGGGN